MMSKNKTFFKIVVPIIIIVLGIVIMKTMISRRQAPAREIKTDPGILVEVLKVSRQEFSITVKGTGTVEASREVSIIPQVSGKVVSISPALVVGGFFREGETLFEIEDIDYRLSLQQAESSQSKAEYELATMESQAQIARAEWESMNNDNNDPPNPLVLYGPQLKSAQAGLAAASAQVEQARIDLERTKVKAPFSARVRSESIDTGQLVRSGNIIGMLAGTETAEISVPLPLDELFWLDIPRHGEKQNGADASVHLNLGRKKYTWYGHVVRSTGEVDPKSRMMNLIVEVQDPYGLKENKGPSYHALAAGSFVDVLIQGKTIKGVFIIPGTALRDNSTVWIMDNENKLNIKKVTTIRMERDRVVISEGLVDGEMIVLTNISGAADGMKLRMMK